MGVWMDDQLSPWGGIYHIALGRLRPAGKRFFAESWNWKMKTQLEHNDGGTNE